jgi:hypothetical protein
MAKPSLKAFQVTREQFSYSSERQSWNGRGINVQALIYLTVSFIYRGEEYENQQFAVMIRSPEIVDGEKVYNAIKIDPPSNFHRDWVSTKAYSEGMREASREAVLAYIRTIPQEKLESETRKAVLARFDSLAESKKAEIKELECEMALLAVQRDSFSFNMMHDYVIAVKEDQLNSEVFR